MKRLLTKNQINALSEYLTILRREYRDKVVDVLLFGSVARGDYDEESDIDILVVVKNGEAKLQDEISTPPLSPHPVREEPRMGGALAIADFDHS